MSSGSVNPPGPGRNAGWEPPWASLTLVALSFGVIEATLVAAYRSLLDPQGTAFPLLPLPPDLLVWEKRREAATLLLLLGTARLAAPRWSASWASFFYAFALWDLVYYATLRAALGWPAHLFAWDLLFLLPVPWLAPVYAPVLVSLVLLAVGVTALRFEAQRGGFRVGALHVAAALLGGGLGLWSFVRDPGARALQSLPSRYAVELLLAGLALGIAAYVHAYRGNLRRTSATAGRAEEGEALKIP